MAVLDPPVTVLLVGTLHMSNPDLDLANVEVDDVLAPKRQRELEEVVDRLSRFEPTKVAVEALVEDAEIESRYSTYVMDGLELQAHEREQLGFRVARGRNHAAIYPINVMDVYHDARVERLVGRSKPDRERWEDLGRIGLELTERCEEWLDTETWIDVLRRINAPEFRSQTLAPYLTHVLPLGGGSEYVGAVMVGNWYRRNLKILANLRRVAQAGDRVLVIYGFGHIPVLEHLIAASPEFVPASVERYLGVKP